MFTNKTQMEVLNKRMRAIATCFFDSKREMGQKAAMEDSGSQPEMDSRALFIKKVEEVYSQLNSLEQLFINNEYFYQDYSFWWHDLYAATTYYRYKKKAVVRFLRLFFNES